jgi:hypothetical protein
MIPSTTVNAMVTSASSVGGTVSGSALKTVRSARYPGAMLAERCPELRRHRGCPGIAGPVGTLTAESGRPVIAAIGSGVIGGVAGLHRGDDTELSEPPDLVGGEGFEVLDPVPGNSAYRSRHVHAALSGRSVGGLPYRATGTAVDLMIEAIRARAPQA